MGNLPTSTDAVIEKVANGYVLELHDVGDWKQIAGGIDEAIVDVGYAIREALKNSNDNDRIRVEIKVSRCNKKK